MVGVMAKGGALKDVVAIADAILEIAAYLYKHGIDRKEVPISINGKNFTLVIEIKAKEEG